MKATVCGGIVTGWIAIVPALLHAQVHDAEFERVAPESLQDGVNITCILQDHSGFLWVGTDDALGRYDGYEFMISRHEAEDSSSIVPARVQSLWEDRHGTLWVGTWGGLERFNRTSGTFTRFLPDPSAVPGDWANVIYGLFEDSRGILWTAGDGVKTFDRSAGKFTSFRHDERDPGSVLSNSCQTVYEDKEGVVWIGTSAGLDCYDRTTGTFRHLWVDEYHQRGLEPDFFGNHWIQKIFEDRTGRLWLGTNGGPVAFNRTTGEFRAYDIHRAVPDSSGAHSVASICEDDAGVLWVGTHGGGILSYDARADSFVPSLVFDSLASQARVTSLYKDSAGTIWIGTGGNGLWKISPARKKFSVFTHDAGNPAGLSNNEVISIVEFSPGIITVATGIGNDVFDPRSGAFSIPVPWERPYAMTGWVRSRSGIDYTGIKFDGFNIIKGTPRRRRFISTRDAGLGGSACSFFEDRRGIIWMLTSTAGVCQFDPRTEEFKKLGIGNAQPFVSGKLILEDSLDDSINGWALWIGTQGGLWRYDASSDAFARFGHDPSNPASISSNSINVIFRDARGILWIGTDRGLNRMDSLDGTFTRFDEREGLGDPHVLGILEDRRGQLWMSGRSMLMKFNARQGNFNTYNMDALLKNIQFAAGCCLRSSTGELYFGGQGGFVMFHPDSIKDNAFIPPTVLTGLVRSGQDVSLDSAIAEANAIRLSHDDSFAFKFASLNFTHPEDNRYAYVLEGHDAGWSYAGGRRYARYSDVKPGTYTFRVRGSNNDGIWNEEGTSIAIIVAPPFWKTTWFTISAGVMALFTMGGTIRYVERRKLKKRIAELERERAVERERARISQDMHDEVGSSLSEIAILSELAKKKPAQAEEHVQEISERTAELIDNVSEIVWAMNPKNDTLDNLVSHLRRYTVKYLSLAGISCKFAVPETLPPSPLASEVRRNIFLVVKEALHNVVKYSSATEVMVDVEMPQKSLQIRIQDNGRGFDPAAKADAGNGLGNMKKRMTDVGGTFQILSEPGCGTEVVLHLRV